MLIFNKSVKPHTVEEEIADIITKNKCYVDQIKFTNPTLNNEGVLGVHASIILLNLNGN